MSPWLMVVLSLVAGLLPGFAWLAFYMGEDDHAEPKQLIIFTFIAGMAFAYFTIAVENLFTGALNNWHAAVTSVAALLGFALIEEVMKFAAAHFAASKSTAFAQPIDAMIYLIVAALGFATLENIGALSNVPPNSLFLPTFFETLSFRFVGATLLHSLTSAVVGYYWAFGAVRQKPGRFIAFGLALASVLHAAFNYLILDYGNGMYMIVFVLIVGFFVLNDFEKVKEFPAQVFSKAS